MKRTTTTTIENSELITIALDQAIDIGQTLKRISREQPRAILVWISPREQSARAELIAELRRRRPRLPLIALTNEPDPAIERAARIAGAAFYFPITRAADEQLLRSALTSLGVHERTPEHSGLPPPIGPPNRPPARASPCLS